MFNFTNFNQAANKTLAHLETELGALRTGGASPQLLDSVKVDAYGTTMKATEVAAITISDPTLLIVSPWDASLVGAIEKAIQVANLNLNPVVDGKIIRLSIPPLTQETRQELVKTLHRQIEDGKVMVRTLRSETKKEIEKQTGSAGISEDNIKADLAKLEEEIKKIIVKIETLAQNKENQLLKV